MDELKEKLKKFAKGIIRSKKILIALVIMIIIFLLASFIMLLTLDDGTYQEGNSSNVPYVVSTYVDSAKFTENGIVFIHKKIDESTGEEVEEILTSSEMAQFKWNELIDNKSNIRQYLDTYEELEKLVNAQIITQFPKVNNPTTGLNGTIEFQRHRSDGHAINMSYTSMDNLNSLISSNNADAKNYYSLDENNDLVIAVENTTVENITTNDPLLNTSDYSLEITDTDGTGSNYSKTTTKLVSQTVNYKNMITQYTMPFQYLWTFITIGDDKRVGLELADLVNDSQIIIAVHDSMKTTTNTIVSTYKKENKVQFKTNANLSSQEFNLYLNDKEVVWNDGDGVNDTVYTTNYTNVYTANLPVVAVIRANVWIVDYTSEYTLNGATEDSKETNQIEKGDQDYPLEPDKKVIAQLNDGSDLPEFNKYKQKLQTLLAENGISLSSISLKNGEADYYSRTIGKIDSNETVISKQEYVKGATNSIPKIQKKTEEEIKNGTGPVNFVTILSDARHANARNKICVELVSWLFDLLEKNPDTVNMVDLTKYLLYIVTGRDYGVTEYDFGVYDPGDFKPIDPNPSIYDGTIQEKVWFALKDLGLSDIVVAGAMGNIDLESGGFAPGATEKGGTGIGLIQWSFSRADQLRAYANSKGVPWQDEDTQIEFLIAEIAGTGPAASYANVRTRGYIGDEKVVSTNTDWKNSTTIEDSTLHFMRFFESPRNKASYDRDGTWGLSRLNRAKKYLAEFAGKPRGGGGGDYNPGGGDYVIGKFTSTVTGKTFTIFNQMKITTDRLWSDRCNRAAQISVCSGYYSGTNDQLINAVSSSAPQHGGLYNACGLTYYDNSPEANSSISANTIKNAIQSRGYVLPYLKGSKVGHSGNSKYGRHWAGSMHWVAILGYKVENGQEKIFVSDPGHGNTGWHPIDEFDGLVSHFVIVKEK